MSNSRALVIKSIKQGETSSIVSCYLEEIGFKSFIVKGLYGQKKSKFSRAHFFPLNFINLNYTYNEKRELGYIKEVKPEILYKTLHVNIQELEVNNNLFNFLFRSLMWYDKIPECNIYHIKFLIELSKYIGFYPNIINEHDMYFCLESGSTTNTKPLGININGVDLKLLKNLLGMEFEDLNSISINKMSRVRILNYLIDYYSLHLQMFKTPKSINVFTQVFK